LRIGKNSYDSVQTRRWTTEESAAFEASLAMRKCEQRPELATVKNLRTQGPTKCAGCGVPIERGQARIESWSKWAEGDPLPELPERTWHSFDCLRKDEELETRRHQR